jgi:chromosome segregation ATPase
MQVRDVHGRLVAESDKRAACTAEIDFLQGRIEELQDGVQDLVTLTVALDELGPTFVESTKTVVEDRARLAAGARRLKMLADKRGKESSDREAVIGGLSEEVAEWEQRAEELILEVERLKEEDVAKSGEVERLEREVEEVKGELESARSMGAALQVSGLESVMQGGGELGTFAGGGGVMVEEKERI